jgi:uncharacterized protein (DUF58 family)
VPTARGWLVALAGLALIGAGTLFGTRSLWQFGVALIALTAAAVGVVRRDRHRVEITRRVSPERATPGQPVAVAVAVVNNGSRASPLLLLEEHLSAGLVGGNRFAVRGIEGGGRRGAALTLRAARRGHYVVGPMEVSIVDPFSLARTSSVAAGRINFLVHPRIEPLALPRAAGDRRNSALSALRQPTGARGEDFYTLREYVEGDDLRKIHWASTAKSGRYMIRQEETPWQTRATVLLDDRAAVHDGWGGQSSFERAIEAAASLVDLYGSSGYSCRLLGCHEGGVASGKGAEHQRRCLDLLATIETQRSAGENSLAARVAELERSATAEASLVVVTGTLTSRDALALTRCTRRFAEVSVICFPGHRFSGQTTRSRWEGETRLVEAMRMLTSAGIRTLALGPDEHLPAAWSTLYGGRAQEAVWGTRAEPV